MQNHARKHATRSKCGPSMQAHAWAWRPQGALLLPIHQQGGQHQRGWKQAFAGCCLSHLQTQGASHRPVQVRLMLLAALCGEHLLLLGPPGARLCQQASTQQRQGWRVCNEQSTRRPPPHLHAQAPPSQSCRGG